jgi:hypothetical protein
MKYAVAVILVACGLFSVTPAQNAFSEQRSRDTEREQKMQQIKDLNSKISTLVEDLLLPTRADIRLAEAEGVQAVRLAPREKFGWIVSPQGGGSYYSFTTGSHDYQEIAQIKLEQNALSVGFAGANYGFLIDLGESSLSNISKDTPEARFLFEYAAPATEPVARAEAGKLQGYNAGGFIYKSHLPAILGHTYLLRSITFGRADQLVAIRIVRKDSDGSLILNWKPLQTFDKPELKQ